MYPTLLCRALGAPQINLGFSAGARGESRMAEVIAGLKLSALVIDYDHNDTYLTVYDPDSALIEKIRALAAAEGLFLWQPPQEGSAEK